MRRRAGRSRSCCPAGARAGGTVRRPGSAGRHWPRAHGFVRVRVSGRLSRYRHRVSVPGDDDPCPLRGVPAADLHTGSRDGDQVAGGRTLIRDELVLDGSYAWHDLADLASQPDGTERAAAQRIQRRIVQCDLRRHAQWTSVGHVEVLRPHGKADLRRRVRRFLRPRRADDVLRRPGTGDYRGQSVWISIFPAAPGAVNMSGYFLSRNS